MIGVIIALVFCIGSIGLVTGIIISNQLNPNYNSALAVPIFNALGIILALIGLTIALVTYQKHKNIPLAKRVMIVGVLCVVILVLLFPLSNMGYLSSVH